MTDPDVTPVTRNGRHVPDELKLAFDLLATAAMIYYVTHPDAPDRLRDTVATAWSKFVHKVSIWAARQDIRTLPETDEVPE